MTEKIKIVQGDITGFDVDAIVNAANNSLLGGGGVDGAIHRAAGPGLLEETRKMGGCPTGEARVSQGHNLKAQWVIHTVGPVWKGGGHNEEKRLADCYKNSLAAAVQKGAKTVAFPAISTGVYGFPLRRATEIALAETEGFLVSHKHLDQVIFVCFSKEALNIYQDVFSTMSLKRS